MNLCEDYYDYSIAAEKQHSQTQTAHQILFYGLSKRTDEIGSCFLFVNEASDVYGFDCEEASSEPTPEPVPTPKTHCSFQFVYLIYSLQFRGWEGD